MENSTAHLFYSDELTRDILITALEGGINYWAEFDSNAPSILWTKKQRPDLALSEVAFEVLKHRGSLHFVDAEDGEPLPPLFINNLYYGIKKFQDLIRPVNLEDHICDAEDADIIIQYSMFGELRYG